MSSWVSSYYDFLSSCSPWSKPTEIISIFFRATHPSDTVQRQFWRHLSLFLPQTEASESLSVTPGRCPGRRVTRWRSSMENTRAATPRPATILTTDRGCLITNTQVCLQWILMVTRAIRHQNGEWGVRDSTANSYFLLMTLASSHCSWLDRY